MATLPPAPPPPKGPPEPPFAEMVPAPERVSTVSQILPPEPPLAGPLPDVASAETRPSNCRLPLTIKRTIPPPAPAEYPETVRPPLPAVTGEVVEPYTLPPGTTM